MTPPVDIEIKPSAGKNLTPSMPKEVPAELKAMEFKVPDSSLFGDSDSTIKVDGKEVKTEIAPAAVTTEPVKEVKDPPTVTEKKVEATKTEEKKPEVTSVLKPPTDKKDKPVEVQKDKGADKGTIKPITPVKESKDEFDYSRFTEEQKSVLKQMSAVGKKEYAKLVDENKQLAALKDANYLQHENGYTLNPDFQELQVKNYKAQLEAQCWEKSLLDIKQGKEYQEIVGFDKNNNPILSASKKPTDRDEIRISNNLQACINASSQFTGKLQEFPVQYKQRINQDLNAIRQVQKERFAWHQDPAILDYTVEVEGQGAKKVIDIKNEFKSAWPAYLQNSPAVDVCSDMFAAMIIQGAELREARNSQQIAQIKQEEVARGEPSSDNREVATKPTVGGVKDFSLDPNLASNLGIRL